MENIISEFRVIETEDGYRIEIKGDKKQMKSFMKEHHGRGKHKWHHQRGWGPWGFNPGMWTHMAPCWDLWEEVDETESEAESA
ncbi:MAG: hypothetical protein ACK2U3_02970 [Anaerolineales bacterium]